MDRITLKLNPVIHFTANQEEEGARSRQKGGASSISREKGWAEENRESIVRKTPEELWHR